MNKKTLMNIPRNAVMEGNDVASLNWTIVSQAAIATLEEELASISRFSLDVSGEFKTDGDSVKVELIDGAGEALKNTEDWNKSDLKTSSVSVTLNRYSRPAGLSYKERKSGVQLANKVQTLVRTVAKAFWKDLMAAIAASGAETVNIGPRAGFKPEMMADVIWPSMANGVDAVYLDRMYYSKLIPTNALALNLADGAYSIPGGIHYVEGVNVLAGNAGVGFATRPDALAVAVCLPNIDPKLNLETQVVESPKLGISLLLKCWPDQGTETVYISAELLAGVAVGNKNHLRQLSGAALETAAEDESVEDGGGEETGPTEEEGA